LLPTLPVTPDSRQSRPDLRRVSCETVAGVLEGRWPDVETPLIFDCRYPYEYHGGHIRTAIHTLSVDDVEKAIFAPGQNTATTALIFHCEFSQERAPEMIRNLRRRALVGGLLLPQIYIMKGGYSAFFAIRPDLCEPQAYVSMHSASHAAEMEAHRRSWAIQAPLRKKRRQSAKTSSRFGAEENREDCRLGRSLAHSWDGGAGERLTRMPFSENDEEDTLWRSLHMW
jgi:hypothetical protein